MNFEFTEEQIMIQQAAKDFAERELLPGITERDEKAEFAFVIQFFVPFKR